MGDRPLRLLGAVRGIELVELPEATECCGFGGTFAVKNAEVSSAMLADKVRAVLDTGAEVVCAADNSCLMHIGGALSRQRTGRADRASRGGAARRWRDGFPRAAARERAARLAAAAQPREGDDDDPRQARGGGRRAARLAGAARGGPGDQGPDALATSGALLERLESAVGAAGGVVHWASDGDEACSIVAGIAARRRLLRGGQGQVDRHRRDPAQRAPRGRRGAGGRDGPGRADHPAGRRRAVAHPRAGDPQEPRRDPRPVRRASSTCPTSATSPRRSPRPPGCTCGASSCRRRMGISGANFAVAETGTVCVFESEGNGRMCTTLPEVLVTVMGIEKLVPSWRDMEVFLQLLPRSSTGERMNPYTSFWTGVRPGDGPREFHLVLLDNGRTDVLADQVGRQALRCIRCSACLNVVPGLLARRRPRLRVRLSGADRGDPDAAAARPARRAARCRTRRPCAAPATRSARWRSTSRACWCTCAAGSSTPSPPGSPRRRR